MSFLHIVAGVILTAGSAASGASGSPAQGTTGAEFLTLGVGARAIAMGGAYSAAADEASALYWNPAAMTRVPNRSLTLMRAAYVASTALDYGAYVQNLGKSGALGVGVQYFSFGSIPETDESFSPIGTASPYDLALSLGYAYEFGGAGALNGFSLGLSGKMIESKLVNNSARTAAMDAGILTPRYLNNRLRLAFLVQNLGASLKYDQASEKLPLVVKAGAAYRISSNWLATLDAAFPGNDDPYLNAGTEYLLVGDGWWRFAGRAGLSSQTRANAGGLAGLAAGFGVGYGGFGADYAFSPYAALGNVHRLSLTYNF